MVIETESALGAMTGARYIAEPEGWPRGVVGRGQGPRCHRSSLP